VDGDAFGAYEQAGWSDGRAAPYHHGLGLITARAIPALLDVAAVSEGTAVLDVATGPGYAAAAAAERGGEVVGVDFAPEMLELAARLHPQVRFQHGDARALPFEDGAFDAVIAAFLMPHVADLPAVVGELTRVVRPGGRVALTTWDPEPATYLRAFMEAIADAGAAPPADMPAGPPFFQYGTDDEFAALLRGAGLADPSVETISFTHHVDDLDVFWADLLGGTVRTGPVIKSQTPEVQARIRSLYERNLGPWRAGNAYDVACSIKVGAAAKP